MGSNPTLSARYIWRIRKYLPERHGQTCKILAMKRTTVLLEFSDGYRVVTSLNFIRKEGKHEKKTS